MRIVLIQHIIIVILNFLVSCKSTEKKEDVIKDVDNSVSFCIENKASFSGIDRLPQPQLRNSIGDNSLNITTQSDSAQIWFNQGLNLLHGFWHLEAYRAFREVVKQDSNCAMGYWGMAMCQPGFSGSEPVWRRAIEQALTLSQNTSRFEQELIKVSHSLIMQGMNESVIEDFRTLILSYPEEPESVAFAGVFMLYSGNAQYRSEAIEILKKGFDKFPNNIAVGHYYTHAMEYTRDFYQARDVAERTAKLGAGSPHLLHMPGHIYFLSGDYQKAVDAFTASLLLDKQYHKAEKIPFISNQNFLHNLHYLTIAQAENQQRLEASNNAQLYANLLLKTPVPNIASENLYYFQGRLLPAFVDIRYRDWQRATEKIKISLNKLDQPITKPLVRKHFLAMVSFCKGMQHIENGRAGLAQKNYDEMTSLISEYNQLGLQMKQSSEFQLINKSYDLMNILRLQLLGWIRNVDPSKEFDVQPFREALKIEELIGYTEPPLLAYPVFESMGLCLKKFGDDRYKGILGEALNKRPNSKLILSKMN